MINVATKTDDEVCKKHCWGVGEMQRWYEVGKVNLRAKLVERKEVRKQWLTNQSPESYAAGKG